jgi:hypothetical protein
VGDPSLRFSRWPPVIPTEAARNEFLASQFRELALTALDPAEVRERHHPLAPCVGSEISSVTFVAGYVQVRFNAPSGRSDPCLNLYAWPDLISDARLRQGDAGYIDALVGLVGAVLAGVDEILDLGLVLNFNDGRRLIEPLDGRSLKTGPEIAEYSDDQTLMIWGTGDPIAWIPSQP